MGMSMNESKQSLSYYQKLFNSLNGDYKLSQVQASELSHSIGTALDAMRKYQKIQTIIKAVDDRDIGYATMIDALHEVIEDGNDTTDTGSN